MVSWPSSVIVICLYIPVRNDMRTILCRTSVGRQGVAGFGSRNRPCNIAGWGGLVGGESAPFVLVTKQSSPKFGKRRRGPSRLFVSVVEEGLQIFLVAMMKIVFAAVALLLVAAASADDVVVLGKSNFDEVVKGNQFVLVEFYVRNFAPAPRSRSSSSW